MPVASMNSSVHSGLAITDQAEQAFSKIVRYARAREQSSVRVREKLVHVGFASEAIERALERAIDERVIDDRRYADCLIRSSLAQGKGLELVLQEIEGLGLAPESLDAYRVFLEEQADRMTERALAMLKRHRTTSKNVRASCYRKLIAKGYSPSVAAEATDLFCAELEEADPSSCLE